MVLIPKTSAYRLKLAMVGWWKAAIVQRSINHIYGTWVGMTWRPPLLTLMHEWILCFLASSQQGSLKIVGLFTWQLKTKTGVLYNITSGTLCWSHQHFASGGQNIDLLWTECQKEKIVGQYFKISKSQPWGTLSWKQGKKISLKSLSRKRILTFEKGKIKSDCLSIVRSE